MGSRSSKKQGGQAPSDTASQDIPNQQASDFAPILFSRTDPEDLAVLDLQARAEIARSACCALSFAPARRGVGHVARRQDWSRKRRQNHRRRGR